MSRDRGPVLKRARALGIEPQYLGVNKKSKRHGAVRRRKKSEYGIQLGEKQQTGQRSIQNGIRSYKKRSKTARQPWSLHRKRTEGRHSFNGTQGRRRCSS